MRTLITLLIVLTIPAALGRARRVNRLIGRTDEEETRRRHVPGSVRWGTLASKRLEGNTHSP